MNHLEYIKIVSNEKQEFLGSINTDENNFAVGIVKDSETKQNYIIYGSRDRKTKNTFFQMVSLQAESSEVIEVDVYPNQSTSVFNYLAKDERTGFYRPIRYSDCKVKFVAAESIISTYEEESQKLEELVSKSYDELGAEEKWNLNTFYLDQHDTVLARNMK